MPKRKSKQKRTALPPPQVEGERCAHPECNELVSDHITGPPASAPPTSALPAIPTPVHSYPGPANFRPTANPPAEASSSQSVKPGKMSTLATPTSATANPQGPAPEGTVPASLKPEPKGLNPAYQYPMVYAYCPSCTMKGAAYASPIAFPHPSKYFRTKFTATWFSEREADIFVYKTGLDEWQPTAEPSSYPPFFRDWSLPTVEESAPVSNKTRRARASSFNLQSTLASILEDDEIDHAKSGGKKGSEKIGVGLPEIIGKKTEEDPFITPPPCGFCNRRVLRLSNLEFEKASYLAYKDHNDGAGIQLYDHQLVFLSFFLISVPALAQSSSRSYDPLLTHTLHAPRIPD
jgi:hypothetical protein